MTNTTTTNNTVIEMVSNAGATTVEAIKSFIQSQGTAITVSMLNEALASKDIAVPRGTLKAGKIEALAAALATDETTVADNTTEEEMTMNTNTKEETTMAKDIEIKGKNGKNVMVDMAMENDMAGMWGVEIEDSAPTVETKQEVRVEVEEKEKVTVEEKPAKTAFKKVQALESTLKWNDIINDQDELTVEYKEIYAPQVTKGILEIDPKYFAGSGLEVKKASLNADSKIIAYVPVGEKKPRGIRLESKAGAELAVCIIRNASDNKALVLDLVRVMKEGKAPEKVTVIHPSLLINNLFLELGNQRYSLREFSLLDYKEQAKFRNYETKQFKSGVRYSFNGDINPENYGKEGNLLVREQDSVTYKLMQPETESLSYVVEKHSMIDGVDTVEYEEKVVENARIIPNHVSIDGSISLKLPNWVKDCVTEGLKSVGEVTLRTYVDGDEFVETTLTISGQSISGIRNGAFFANVDSITPYADVLDRLHLIPQAFAGDVSDAAKRSFLNIASGIDMGMDKFVEGCKIRISQETYNNARCIQVDFIDKVTGVLVLRNVFASCAVSDVERGEKYLGFNKSATTIPEAVVEVPEEIKEAFGKARNVSDGYYLIGDRPVAFNYVSGLMKDKALSHQGRSVIYATDKKNGRFAMPAIKGLAVPGGKINKAFGNADFVFLADAVKSKGIFEVNGVRINFKDLTVDGVVEYENAGMEMYRVGAVKRIEPVENMASQMLQHFLDDEQIARKLVNTSIAYTVEKATEGAFEEIMESEKELDEVFGSDYVSDKDIALAAIKANTKASNDPFIRKAIFQEAFNHAAQLYLNNRVSMEYSKSRYMLIDVLAVGNAIEAGHVNDDNEIVVRSYEQDIDHTVIGHGKAAIYTQAGLLLGTGLSIRFPFSKDGEAHELEAVEYSEYNDAYYVLGGEVRNFFEGCIMYDARSVALEAQSGADEDGDKAKMAWYKSIIHSYRKNNAQTILDIWFDADQIKADGKVIKKANWNTGSIVMEEMEKEAISVPLTHGLASTKLVGGKFDSRVWAKALKNGTAKEQFAEGMKAIARHGIGLTNNLGMYANTIMILMDIRTTLTNEKEQAKVDQLVLAMLFCVRWEVDKAKHGGSFAKQPAIANALATVQVKFEEGVETEEAAEQLLKAVLKEQGGYEFLADHMELTFFSKKYQGARLVKPQWLASQKDKFGSTADSLMGRIQEYTEDAVIAMSSELLGEMADGSTTLYNVIMEGEQFSEGVLTAIKGALKVFHTEYKKVFLSKMKKMEELDTNMRLAMTERDSKTDYMNMNGARFMDIIKTVGGFDKEYAELKQLKADLNSFADGMKRRITDAIPFSNHMIAIALYDLVSREKSKSVFPQRVGNVIKLVGGAMDLGMAWRLFGKELAEILSGVEYSKEVGSFERLAVGFKAFPSDNNMDNGLEVYDVETLLEATLVRKTVEFTVKGKKAEKDCLVLVHVDGEEVTDLAYAEVNPVSALIIPVEGGYLDQEDIVLEAGVQNEDGSVAMAICKR